jgi:tetratricopeptide (TPR) repeat protein
MQKEALRIRRAHFGASHPAVAESLGNLGYALWHGQSDARWNDAERHYRMSIDMYDRNGLQDSNDRARFTFSLAVMLRVQGRHDEAERAFADAARIYRGTPSPEDRYRFECLHRYAALAAERGRLCKAERLLREAEGLLQDHDGPAAVRVHWSLAGVLHAKGDREAAVAMFRQALRSAMIDARKQHPAACNWDALLLALDLPSDSLRAGADTLHAAFACLAGTMRADRASLAQAILRTGHALCCEGDHSAAESILRIAVEHDASCVGSVSRWTVETRNALAKCLIHQGRNEEARQILQERRNATTSLWKDHRPGQEEDASLLTAIHE